VSVFFQVTTSPFWTVTDDGLKPVAVMLISTVFGVVAELGAEAASASTKTGNSKSFRMIECPP
jgi:hypothetical protein